MRASRLGSVASLSLLVSGCATHAVTFERDAARGYITIRPGQPGFVVAAPHGTSDPLTGEIASEIAHRTGFGLVVATGFALEPDHSSGPGRRYQVNRPLEGVPGQPPAQEVATDGARQVYEAYEKHVTEVAQGPLRFYAEVHGNNRRESARRIEVATVGVDRDAALKLRTLLELIRDAHLRGEPRAPRLDVLIEPADVIVYAASGAKRSGILKLPERGLHIELPRSARRDWRLVYTAILAEFLVQAATLR